MILIDNISKSYDGQAGRVVDGLTLKVPEGSTLVLLGHSGCGKTTLLKMIARLEAPTKGAIFVDGTNIYEHGLISLRRMMGYVFQYPGLFPHMTIERNVGIILKLEGMPKYELRARVEELLDLVGLNPEAFRNRYPHELSGGQQQRVGVARALATKPRYMLMDEPFGALDNITRRQMQEEMRYIRDKTGVTVIFVTHDIFEAMHVGDFIAVMNKGKIEQLGTPEEIIRYPKTPYVREFIAKPVEEVQQMAGALLEREGKKA